MCFFQYLLIKYKKQTKTEKQQILTSDELEPTTVEQFWIYKNLKQ